MSKRSQPSWKVPPRPNRPVLKLFNSLTRQKEEFVPENGNRVMWYSCGPTVYDAAHMGHARSYISFDILRRILSDYFGYDVFYVMNITDIDDKIIRRARQNYLYDKYIQEERSLEVLLSDAKESMSKFSNVVLKTNDLDKKQMMERILNNLTTAVENLEIAVSSNDANKIEVGQQELVSLARDPISEWLDSKFGSSVADNAIFITLPRFWEQEFHNDMDSLNVLRPHVLTRVSEYIPEIIDYIKKIISNGLAYESNGSVYFDVGTFDKKEHHYYAKLVPEAYGDASSLQEGEGDLSSQDQQQTEKRSPTDFALWKRSKGGEPAWDSPWGKGRPGWHIECSAMASSICGKTLDIHTGGVDLKFPHHDNEIAQSEAYFDSSEWVKYFLHSGHLTIAGCKMSKSLKNFVSIQQALEKHSSRQLRFAFLLHSWKDTLDYSPNTMEIALQYEKIFNEFFLTVKDLTRDTLGATKLSTFDKWGTMEIDLNIKLSKTKESVYTALCDNIDTRTAMDCLRDIVCSSNIYIRENKPPNSLLLRDIAIYVTEMLTIFGAVDVPKPLGFPVGTSASGDTEQILMPYLSILADFRDNIRVHARTLKATDILTECDKLRDEVLPNVGVRLEDREGGASAVKLVDKETLLKEKEAKKQAELEKAAEKERKKAELVAAQAAKEAQKKIKSSEMFLNETDKYSKFDEQGLPTHDHEGKEISKGLLKKLTKLQQTQEKKYQEYVASLIK